VQSAQRQVDADPTSAQAHYALGRAHYLAWSFKSLMIPGFERGEGAEAAPAVLIASRDAYADRLLRNEAARRVRERLGWDGNTTRPPEFTDQLSAEIVSLQAAKWAPPSPPQEELDEHAMAALKALQQAVKLDPNSGATLLCLANLEEEFADRAAELWLDFDGNKLPDSVQIDPNQYARMWRTKAADVYAKVYAVSIDADSKARGRTVSEMMALPAYSAIEAYLRLAGEHIRCPESPMCRRRNHRRRSID
jgi:hypothetical protein